MKHLRYLIRRADGLFWSDVDRCAKEYRGDIIPRFESLANTNLAALVHPEDIGRMQQIAEKHGHTVEFVPVEFEAEIAPPPPLKPISFNQETGI